MDAEHYRILLHVLADSEVCWTPFRWSSITAQAATAVSERRANFSNAGGVPLSSASEGAEQKRHQRTIADLETAGMVVVLRGKARRVGGRLTPKGDNLARAIAPGPDIKQSWLLLKRIAEVARDFPRGSFVLESNIHRRGRYDTEAGRDSIHLLEDRCLRWLCGGQVETASDTEGHIGYRITELGREALAAGPPAAPEDIPAYDQALGSQFVDRYLAGLIERENWKPSSPSRIYVPLSSGAWPQRRRRTPIKRKSCGKL